MPATFSFMFNSAAGTRAEITQNDFGSLNSSTVAIASNPITAGEASFERYISGKFSGTFNQIGPNVKFWRSAGTLTSMSVTLLSTTVFATPVTTANADAAEPSAEPGSQSVRLGAVETTAINDTTTVNPAFTQYLRLQLKTDSTRVAGTIDTTTRSLRYDEN